MTTTEVLVPARTKQRILVVDDERSMRELLGIVLRREGYDVLVAESGRQALAVLEKETLDLLISDIKMPDIDGVEVLRAAKKVDEEILGIMITAYASTSTAVEALRMGAYDYLTKPFDVEELKIVVRKALERRHLQQENVLLKKVLQTSHEFSNIIGRSPAIVAIFNLIQTVAKTTSTILVTGESGTGKELVARAIHFNSIRADHPFVPVNCGAFPEALLESELFGHVKGSFTGAAANKKGLVEVAEKGTIFLDEIGEMSPMMQVKLLRVLQERTFRRVGGLEEVEVDIRIIAATNRDLAKMVAEGKFREDLYYRINVIPVHLPPLRDRRDDIPLLASHFVKKYAEQMKKPISGISNDASMFLELYDWPGNIRELENVIERAVALEPTQMVTANSLPHYVCGVSPRGKMKTVALPAGFDLKQHVQDLERDYVVQALKKTGGVQIKAAELLNLSFRQFRYYVEKYNLRDATDKS